MLFADLEALGAPSIPQRMSSTYSVSRDQAASSRAVKRSSGIPSPLAHAPHDFQTTFTPEGSHLTFSSEFDSGNLRKAKYDEHAAEYLCYQTRDAQDTAHEAPYTTWFHFSVSGAKAGETVKFCIKNMNKQMRLYKQGYRPVYKVVPNVVLASASVEEAAVSGYNTWQAIPTPSTGKVRVGEERLYWTLNVHQTPILLCVRSLFLTS